MYIHTRIRKPVRIFVLNAVLPMNKNKILKRRIFFLHLPSGKHHIHGHSLVRSYNLHIKQGKHQYAKQPKLIKEIFERVKN